MEVVKNAFEKSDFSKNYFVEVLQCVSNDVVYSYQIKNESEKNIILCKYRVLPVDCYLVEIVFKQTKTSVLNPFFLLLILIIFCFGFWFFYFRKSENKMVEIEANFSAIGVFSFYPKQHKLMQKSKEINLSKKECELLEIFVANPNQIIKREELTKKVWEDHGVFVGRSLDTYISKLRKKLKDDASIQFINVHGVGYKLEIK